MLGEGLRAGLRYMGIETRPVCFVEREAYPASVMAARMEEGSLDPAPVWPDLLTFDARRWTGAVDGIVAGFPCQDLSLAGRRAGLDGKRSGLFFNILDIADDCGAWFLFLENVSGIASATASVVDEAEGALEERAASRVLGELAERGWNAEWLTLSASDVGASHRRERWFCFAWRPMADAECTERRPVSSTGIGSQQGHDSGRPETHRGAGKPDQVSDNTACPRCDGARGRAAADCESRECLLGEGCEDMAHAKCARWSEAWRRPEQHAGREPEPRCEPLGHPGLQHQHLQQRPEGAEHQGTSSELADASRTRSQTWLPGQDSRERGVAGVAEHDCHARGPFFAPGPADPAWRDILTSRPWLAPAISIEEQHDAQAAFAAAQSDVRGEPDGLAPRLDFDARAQRLKCCGNGVVALQAALAFVVLARRAGLKPNSPHSAGFILD